MTMAVDSYRNYDHTMGEVRKRKLVDAIEGQEDEKEVEELLMSKADPFATEEAEQTAMHEACRSGKHSIVNLLFTYVTSEEEQRKLICTKNTYGETPLHVLGMTDCNDAGKIEDCSTIALKMIRISLNVLFIPDQLGSFPLHELITNGKIDVALAILKEIDTQKSEADKIKKLSKSMLKTWAPDPVTMLTFEYLSINATMFINLTNKDKDNLIDHAVKRGVASDKIATIRKLRI